MGGEALEGVVNFWVEVAAMADGRMEGSTFLGGEAAGSCRQVAAEGGRVVREALERTIWRRLPERANRAGGARAWWRCNGGIWLVSGGAPVLGYKGGEERGHGRHFTMAWPRYPTTAGGRGSHRGCPTRGRAGAGEGDGWTPLVYDRWK